MSEPPVNPDSAEPHASPLHVEDSEVSLRDTPPEGWVALALFGLLGATVLYQFITRYALNDSAAWTEEIARYLLICTVFTGMAAAVRSSDQIRVDLLYRYLPKQTGRVLALCVEGFSLLFFSAMLVLSIQMMLRLGDYRMTALALPMNVVFGVCALAFGTAALRAGLALREKLREQLHGGGRELHQD